MKKAGKDIEPYSSHSTRSAFTSKAKVRGITELLDGVQIQPLEKFLTNLFIETMGIQLLRLNIIQHVQNLYIYFKSF